jgi:hypothetical protein
MRASVAAARQLFRTGRRQDRIDVTDDLPQPPAVEKRPSLVNGRVQLRGAALRGAERTAVQQVMRDEDGCPLFTES